MIFIFSTQDWDTSTEDLMDWIQKLGGECIRYNGEELIGEEEYCLELSADTDDLRLGLGDGRTFRAADSITAVWYRRGGRFSGFSVQPYVDDHEVSNQINGHLRHEMRETARALHAMVGDLPWLSRPSKIALNKVATLRTARRAGLDIPATLITNSRAELEAFYRKRGGIVTKAISDGDAFFIGDHQYAIYTESVSAEDIEQLPETFLPTLVQERLNKTYELRIFYLAGTCYPMAIFSQLDRQTSVDFRRYNLEEPNRRVPYKLSPKVEEGIRAVMDELGLATGSIDLVKTTDGRLVFLEVNPVGQFGMVSKPCNYGLERKMAEHLLALSESEEE